MTVPGAESCATAYESQGRLGRVLQKARDICAQAQERSQPHPNRYTFEVLAALASLRLSDEDISADVENLLTGDLSVLKRETINEPPPTVPGMPQGKVTGHVEVCPQEQAPQRGEPTTTMPTVASRSQQSRFLPKKDHYYSTSPNQPTTTHVERGGIQGGAAALPMSKPYLSPRGIEPLAKVRFHYREGEQVWVRSNRFPGCDVWQRAIIAPFDPLNPPPIEFTFQTPVKSVARLL
ncbi:hypothetical protein C8Q78DRAFT_1081078 [Trametes maxima]|nr:hypothetical protein C8Q78DRAFT_1081078 [Trametes maxima]